MTMLLQGEGQAVFQLPSTVARATREQLVESQYTPSQPGSVRVTEVGEDSVQVSWEASTCSHMYDVTYEELSGAGETLSRQVEGSVVTLTGLQACSEYEVRVTAVTGQEYSEGRAALFYTLPSYSAAEKLEPVLITTTDSVTAQWKGFEKLSCVKKYSVVICKQGDGCLQDTEVLRDDAVSVVQFVSSVSLDQCSDYSLHIKPTFGGDTLEEKVIPFRTLSQPVEDVASLLTSVQAEAGEEQMISVRWNDIQCASQYEVFQKVDTADGEWEKIGTTKENVFESKGVPCTEYKYGVKVTIDDQESEVVESKEVLMTKIDSSVPYVAANLAIKPSPDGAQLTWDHGSCIKGYKIKVCQLMLGEQMCFEEAVITDDLTMHKMTHTLRNLKPCSKHQLEIYPLIDEDDDLAAEPTGFMTASPPASPPEEVSVRLNRETNKVDIHWSRVECAGRYRIHQKLENSDTDTKWDSDELSVSLESPEPCVTYSYGVSAVLGEEESEPTVLQEVPVPPRVGVSEHPVLVIEERSNGSVTFVINKADKNHHCKVTQSPHLFPVSPYIVTSGGSIPGEVRQHPPAD